LNPLRNGCEISKIIKVKSRLTGLKEPVSLDFLVGGGVWGQDNHRAIVNGKLKGRDFGKQKWITLYI
ncbi:MAG: hypothetical protein ACRC1P_09145, partial [Cellulosilyticaceae bacterium]